MSTWYEQAIFYHMYPLGITGAPKTNVQTEVTDRFKELDQWIPHIRSLGCNAIYIGPLLNHPVMDMTPEITNWLTVGLELTMISANLQSFAMKMALKW